MSGIDNYMSDVVYLGRETGLGENAVMEFCRAKSQVCTLSRYEICSAWMRHFQYFGRRLDFRKSNFPVCGCVYTPVGILIAAYRDTMSALPDDDYRDGSMESEL